MKRHRRGDGRPPSAAGTPFRPEPAERPAFWIVVALLWAVVFAIDPRGRESFRLPKELLGTALAAVSVVALAWSGRLRLDRGLSASPAARALAPLAGVAILSALLSPHPAHVAQTLPLLLVAFAALAGWSHAFSAATLDRLLALSLWPAAALAALGIAQALGLYQPFVFTDTDAARLEITSLAGNVGDFGAALVLPLLLAQHALFTAASRRRRWLALGLALLFAIALVASQTLAALGAAALGSLLLWARLLPRRRWLPVVGALAVAGGLVLLLAAPVRERVTAKVRDLSFGDVNRLLTGRLDGWRAALWMTAAHPLTGVGPGAFVTEFVPAKLALLERGVRFFDEQATPVFANAHSEPLEVAAELGFAGLVALGWGLWVLGSHIRRRPQTAPENALALAVLVALGLLALFDFPFRVALVGYPAALFLARVLHAPGRGEDTPAATRRTRLTALGLALLALLALASAPGRLGANRLVRAAEARTAVVLRGGLDAHGRQLLAGNIAMLEAAIRKDPAAVSARVALGAQYLLLGRAERAIGVYREALALEPRPETHLNLARALSMAGRTEEARTELATALRLAPHLASQIPSE